MYLGKLYFGLECIVRNLKGLIFDRVNKRLKKLVSILLRFMECFFKSLCIIFGCRLIGLGFLIEIMN